MEIKDKKIGVALTGSFCTFNQVIPFIKDLVEEGANVIPIMSEASSKTDTRFGKAKDFIERLEEITGNSVITTIIDAEPIGPKNLTDIMVIAPCSGNTAAKLANGINDTPVLMAVKSHLRNNRPVVIAISTNDGLGASGKNIGILLNTKHIYFVPFKQDAPEKKPKSLVADFSKLKATIEEALEEKQIQPVLL